MKVTVRDVLDRVEAIRECAGDNEAAHAMEDGLRKDVLEAIAQGNCEDPATLAEAVLLTAEIDFERWCA